MKGLYWDRLNIYLACYLVSDSGWGEMQMLEGEYKTAEASA